MERAARIAAELLQQAAELSAAEVADRLARVRNVDYWRRLAPDLPIAGTLIPAVLDADAGALRTAAARLRRDRYGSIPSVLPPAALASINRSIDVVVGAGWPAIFS